jgi:hypothetical protein
MSLDDLPTLADLQKTPRATPKGLPTVLVKKAKQQSKKQQERAFLEGVWDRDKRRSRASGRPLVRSGVVDADHLGEVHHVLKRSTNPEGKWDVSRGILLSKTEHTLAETRCPQAPEHMLLEIHGDDDLGQPQVFTWRDVHGTVTKTRHG